MAAAAVVYNDQGELKTTPFWSPASSPPADIQAWSPYSAGVPLLVTLRLPNLARRWGGWGAVKRPTPPHVLDNYCWLEEGSYLQ